MMILENININSAKMEVVYMNYTNKPRVCRFYKVNAANSANKEGFE